MITSMLNKMETIDGVACRYTGAAKDIFVLKLPITKNIGELLFAHISVSNHLAKGHRGQTRAWPDGFLEYCAQQHQKVTRTFLRLNPSTKKATPEDQLMWFIGSRVEETVKECKEVINNRLNPAS